MKAHLEITGGIIRIYENGKSFENRDPFKLAFPIIGDENEAILKALRTDQFSRAAYEATGACLASHGFKAAIWSRYKPGRSLPVLIRVENLARFLETS